MTNERRKVPTAASVVLLLALTACATPTPPAPIWADTGAGLAFGAFDFRASDIIATHVVLVRVSPTKMYMGGSGERATVTFTNGEFYAPNLSPGLYSVNGFYSGDLHIGLEGNLKDNTFRVEPGGITYAGSYRVTYTRGKLFRRGDGSFERVDSRQAEGVLLEWLAGELAATDWAARIRARLATVKRG